MTEIEIWKDIPDFEGLYQASSLGKIRSLDRELINKIGVKRFYKGVIMKQQQGERYLQVGFWKDGKLITRPVHALIAKTFHKKPNYLCEVLHINNIRTDNRAVNLKWGTHLQNMQDAFRDGINTGAPFGWQRPKCKFKTETYKTVFILFNEGKLNKEQISKKVGVQSGTVHKWLKTYIKHRDKINKLLEI